jgi:signal transduction histidine kinase
VARIMTFKSKLIAGLAAASAVLLLVAILSYQSLVRNAADRRWVTHTYQVLQKLDDLQIGMADAETGQRGYILTGENSYLDPYENALGQILQNVRAVRELTADNPNQQRSLDRLQPLIAAKLAELQDRINVRRQQGLAAGVDAVREGSGKQYMDEIRVAIAAMKQEEERLLVLRSNELEVSSHAARVIIVIGEVLAFVFLFAAGLVIQQEMNRRRLAEEEIRGLNADLEKRVAERTAELAERAKDLERSNMELQQFAYVASHDLQEPLRTIASFTQLLAKRYNDKLDDKAREFINYAVDGSKRMQTLINDLLAFSRVGTQAKTLETVRCDAVLDRVLKNLKLAIQDSGATITRDRLPTVLADEVQLSQIFQNLLGNAIKFRGSDAPRIHVSAERQGAAWKVMVRDNGIGISPDHNDRIFVIFQRLHTKTQYPGTGIGLAICKKIAERHGGRIWVEPSPGGGSTFYFTIAAGETANAEEIENHELRINAATH